MRFELEIRSEEAKRTVQELRKLGLSVTAIINLFLQELSL